VKYAWILVSALFCVSPPARAQNGATTAKYSFTISAAQTWTDAGLDLASGDALTFTAEAKSGGESDCNPSGTGAAGSGDKLPLASAPSGAVIARTSERGDAALVGSSGSLKADSAGHLFIGVNEATPSNCAFVVKVQIASAQASPSQNAHPPTDNAKPGNTAAQNAAAANAADTTQHPALKEQLSSAAQVWLKGQFGNSSSSSNDQASNAVSGNGAASASASTGLKLPTVVLDADLRQHIDGLPRRVHDHAGNQGDMVNFVVVGSQESMQAAFDAADWHVADVDSKEAGLKAVLNTYQKKEYLEMPMSHLYLFDRMQDFGYEQAQAFAVVASRHHFRVWKAPFTWSDQVVWVGAATHDIGFEKDIRTGKLTHKIDPDVDSERSNLAEGFDKSDKAKNMTYYLPPNPVQDAKNASGGGYHSDGKLLVVFLK
jgi:hypothetical protein